jgi:tetratricopeptide (TPR) repeat protein
MKNVLIKNIKAHAILILLICLMPWSCSVKGTPEEWYSLGLQKAISGEFEEAKVNFQKSLEIDSSFLPAQESLGVIDKILNKNLTNDAGIYFFRGISYSNEGETDDAIESFSMAIDENSQFQNAYYERGLTYSYTENYDKAISDFSKVVAMDPKASAAYNNRGLVYGKGKKEYDKAIADFNIAIELKNDFADSFDNRGVAYMMRSDDKGKACSDWKRACDLGKCNNYKRAKNNGYCS